MGDDAVRFVVTGVPQKGCYSSPNLRSPYGCVIPVLLMRVPSRPANKGLIVVGRKRVIMKLLRRIRIRVLRSFSPEKNPEVSFYYCNGRCICMDQEENISLFCV